MKKVIIWAESEAEALEFMGLFEADMNFIVSKIYIAKRSSGKRDVGHKYRNGEYFSYDISTRKVSGEPSVAPDSVTEIVQWCSQDIIVTDTQFKPILIIETTYHILTYNNVAQRIPRIVRGSSLGVPSVIFQKVDKSSTTLISWFTKALSNAEEIYKTECLALIFDDDDFEEAKKLLITLLNNLVNSKKAPVEIKKIHDIMDEFNKNYDEKVLINGKRGAGRKWLKFEKDKMRVIIGVRDNCALTRVQGYGCQGTQKEQAKLRSNLSQ
jgi:hypothetical protein